MQNRMGPWKNVVAFLILILSWKQSFVNTQSSSCSCSTVWQTNSVNPAASSIPSYSINPSVSHSMASQNTLNVYHSNSASISNDINPSASNYMGSNTVHSSYSNSIGSWNSMSYSNSMASSNSVNPLYSNSMASWNSVNPSYSNSIGSWNSMSYSNSMASSNSVNPSYSNSMASWNSVNPSYSNSIGSWNSMSYSNSMASSNSVNSSYSNSMAIWNSVNPSYSNSMPSWSSVNPSYGNSMLNVFSSAHTYSATYITECACATNPQTNTQEMMSNTMTTEHMSMMPQASMSPSMGIMESMSPSMMDGSSAQMVPKSSSMDNAMETSMSMSVDMATAHMSMMPQVSMSPSMGIMESMSPSMMDSSSVELMPHSSSMEKSMEMLTSVVMATEHMTMMPAASMSTNMVIMESMSLSVMDNPSSEMMPHSSSMDNAMKMSTSVDMATQHMSMMPQASMSPSMGMMESMSPSMMDGSSAQMMSQSSSMEKSMETLTSVDMATENMTIMPHASMSSSMRMMESVSPTMMVFMESMTQSMDAAKSLSTYSSVSMVHGTIPNILSSHQTPSLILSSLVAPMTSSKSLDINPSPSSSQTMMSSSIYQKTIEKNTTVFNNKTGFTFCGILGNSFSSMDKFAISNIQTDVKGNLNYYEGVNMATTRRELLSNMINSSHAKVLHCHVKLQFLPNHGERGLVTITFSMVATADTYVTTVGKDKYTIYLLVPPVQPKVMFQADKVPINVTTVEDGGCIKRKFDKYEFPELPSNSSNIPYGVEPYLKMDIVNEYKKYVSMFPSKFEQLIKVTNLDKDNGVWEFYDSSMTMVRDSTVKINYSVCFKPSKNYHGTASAVIQPVLKDDTELYSGDNSKIYWTVTNQNDRPEIKERNYQLPALPYNISVGTNRSCHKISTFISNVAEDIDGSVTGIAVINAAESEFGYFEYKCNNSMHWRKINITNNYPQVNQTLNVLYLNQHDSICFVLKNQSLFWLRIDSIHKVDYLAWDGTGNHTCGMNTFNRLNNNNPLSLSANKGMIGQLREDCNRRAGLTAKFDRCGVCDGDNACVGCDGVINSGAEINECRICYGGSTNKTKTAGKDCAGTCNGTAFNDTQCGRCRSVGSRNLTDCNGDCFGSARISDCGVCVGGNTGRGINFTKDACGKCNGDNSTCSDCENVPNGGKTRDLCGNCLSPNDPTRDTSCVALKLISPRSGLSSKNVHIELEIAGASSYPIVACEFIYDGRSWSANSSSFMSNKIKVSVVSPHLPNGKYKINCTLNNTLEIQASGDYYTVNESAIMLTSISPNVTSVNTAVNLTICGDNFFNSPDLKCSYGNGDKKIYLNTYFQNSSCINCYLMAQEKSVISDVYISFTEHSNKYPSLSIKHFISVANPKVVTAAYTQSLAAIAIVFDKNIAFTSIGLTCADVFPYNYTTFGTNPSCRITAAKRLDIFLVGGPTIALGTLKIASTKLKVKNAELTVYGSNEETFVVSGPSRAVSPSIELNGPEEVGDCADIPLMVNVLRGNGGRKLAYKWSVTTTDSLTVNQTNELVSLNQTLATKTSSMSVLITSAKFTNKKLTFTAKGTNLLGNSDIAMFAVTRKSSTLPNVIVEPKITTAVNVPLEIKADTSIPSCSSDVRPVFSFVWSFDRALRIDFKENDLKRRRLIFPVNSLKAGVTYSLSLTVSTAGLSDDVIETVEITTTSSALEASITGPSSIGGTTMLKLDASNSVDPDQSDGSEVFSWTVKESDGNLVYIGGEQLIFADGKIIETDTSKLNVGTMYVFTLTYTKGIRSATAEQKVTVVNGDPPEVIFRTIKNSVLNPSKSIIIEARINSKRNGDYEWMSILPENSDGFNVVEDLVRASSTAISGSYTRPSSLFLVIKPESLQSGSFYRFQLKVKEGSLEVNTFIDIRTNGKPTAGIIQLSANSGVALETKFVVTAGEGFSDPDDDKLFYRFRYRKDGNEVLSDLQTGISFTWTLPAGIIELIVDCFDARGAFTSVSVSVNVTNKVLDDAAYSQIGNDLTDLASSGDTSAVFTFAAAVGQSSDGSSDNISPARAAFQIQALTAITSIDESGAIQDEASKKGALSAIRFSTSGAFNIMTGNQLNGLFNALQNLISNGGNSNSRRKRRAVVLPQVTAKDVDTVENNLQSFDNLIFPNQFDSTSLRAKSDFLNLFDDLSQSMCKSLTVGEEAILAKTKFVLLQAVNKRFDDVDSVPIKLGCSDCPTYRNGSDFVLLSSKFKSTFEDFECQSGSDNCTGLCISSAQLPYDLLSTTSPTNVTRLSGVLLIKFWNPQTYIEVSPTTIEGGMNVSIATTASTNKTYQCRRWQSNKWVESGVYTLTKMSYTKMGGISYVDCNVTTVGYVALFEGPAIVEPSISVHSMISTTALTISATSSHTMMMTSSIATTPGTTTVQPANYKRRIIFSLQHSNCASLYNETTKSTFEENLKTTLSVTFNITKESMTDFNTSCGSVVVTWEQGPSGNFTAEDAEAKIKNVVVNVGINITIGNETSSVVPGSYSSTVVTPLYATTTTKPTEDDDDLSSGAIAGIVIGVLCAFILILILVYFLVIKKKSRKDGTVGPNDDILELRGKQNRGYSNESP